MAQQSEAQKETVRRVMHEFKQGALKSAGRKVRNPKQAIAIGLSEAGASRDKAPARNHRARAKTESGGRKAGGATKAELMREAAARHIAGRSRMTKPELQKALSGRS